MPVCANSLSISCLLPVYCKDHPDHFRSALKSVLNQTLQVNEVLVCADGPLSELLERVLDEFLESLPLRVVRLPKSVGLGAALRFALPQCKGDLVARMDSDDIARPDRFRQQHELMCSDPDLKVVGGAIAEFEVRPGDVNRERRCAPDTPTILRQIRHRNPFNHMTVMFRKDAVMAVGGYRDVPSFEDYDLWLRMAKAGGGFANLSQVLVDVRIGNGLIARRSGWDYLRREYAFLMSIRSEGLISVTDFFLALLIRLPIRVLPEGVIARLYDALLRKRQ